MTTTPNQTQTPNNKPKRVEGILLLDKPAGITSNLALQKVKRLFRAKKAGHTGSLDPLATGLLPLCFGEATKFSSYLLESSKQYHVIAKLGIKTTTADAEGEVIETRPVPALTKESIEAVLAQFRGDIQQIPSMFSAIKHQGQPLYRLARQGIEVERQARPVSIYRLELEAMTEDTLTLDVFCSKGTYVRNLVEDLGEALGCGAHVIVLRRLSVGPYCADQMVTLEELESTEKPLESYLLPVDTAVSHWPAITLTEASSFYIRQGQPVMHLQQEPVNSFVRLFSKEGIFIGIGQVQDDGMIAPRRLIATKFQKTEKVVEGV